MVSNRDSDSISVLFGKGDGSFSSGITVATDDAPHEVKVGDVNGDGYLDIATADQFADSATVLIGNGNGTFKKSVTYYAGEDVNSIAIGDLNNDGALDIATANFTENSVAVLLANTREVSTTPYFNINTRQGALDALDAIGNTSQQISRELGNIGAQQSRLSHTVNHLQIMRENYAAANSKIVDADVAEEVAQMVRQQILQQAITAVLAQANQQPALVLELLK